MLQYSNSAQRRVIELEIAPLETMVAVRGARNVSKVHGARAAP